MTDKEREQLRDQAALAALPAAMADDYNHSRAAANAYRYADAFLAARELPGKYEYYIEAYRKEAAQKEKDRIEAEARRKATAPLFDWAKEHWDGGFTALLFEFGSGYQPNEGKDIVEEFKNWIKATKPSLLYLIK